MTQTDLLFFKLNSGLFSKEELSQLTVVEGIVCDMYNFGSSSLDILDYPK